MKQEHQQLIEDIKANTDPLSQSRLLCQCMVAIQDLSAERRESTVETATDDEEWRQAMNEWKETQSIDLGSWESAVEEIRRDRDAWRTMALALVEKINPPTP